MSVALDNDYATGWERRSTNFVAYPGYYTLAGSVKYKYTTIDLSAKVLTPKDRYLYTSSNLNHDVIKNDLTAKVWDMWRDPSRYYVSDHIKSGKNVETFMGHTTTTTTTINSYSWEKPKVYIQNGMIPWSTQNNAIDTQIYTFYASAKMHYSDIYAFSSQYSSPTTHTNNYDWPLFS